MSPHPLVRSFAAAQRVRSLFAQVAKKPQKKEERVSAALGRDSPPVDKHPTPNRGALPTHDASRSFADTAARGCSGVCESRWVGPSGAVARVVSSVLLVIRRVSGRVVCVFAMNRASVRGGAGLAPAVGLIGSLSALSA